MGNRDIEKNTETTYVKENHGFNYYTLEEVVNGIDGTEIENHFADIYNHLSTILSNENSGLLLVIEKIMLLIC